MLDGDQKDFVIRKAKLRDIGELSDLYLGLSQSSKRLFHPFPFNRGRVNTIFLIMVLSGNLISLVKKTIPRLGFLILVAENIPSRRIDGFCYFSIADRLPKGVLVANRGIVTRDKVRSKGLGTALDTHLIKIARKVGISRFVVSALKDNEISLALHAKMGYRRKGFTRDIWNGEVHDAVILELDLSNY